MLRAFRHGQSKALGLARQENCAIGRLSQGRSQLIRRLLVTTLLLMAAAALGCSRTHYRLRADQDAYNLIEEKANHPHWPLEEYSIQVASSSRMYDPFDYDRPPMPPDDPASHEYMHRVATHRGYPRWHRNGDTPEVENPYWLATLPVDESGQLVLDGSGSVRLALLHSPNYQSELEELYLSALDVSFERFRLDSQFFGGYETELTATARARRGAGGRSRTFFETATFPGSRGIRMQKMGATGTDLVVGLANSLVWQFAGTNTHSATTLLDFSLVQPLLRRAGRDRVLERLTIAERTLLANVRQMERFRREFYVSIITGRNVGSGPSRRGGFFGGSGLDGFTGVGGGGFGRVGGTGAGGGGGTGAQGASGFMGLLQTQQEIRNQQDNVVGLRINLRRLQVFLDESKSKILPDETPTQRKQRILQDSLQVAQARQALYNADSRLLNSYNAYQTSMDTFKGDLGLPPQLCSKIVDSMLDEFILIGPRIRARRNEIDNLISAVGLTNDALLEQVVESPGEEGQAPQRTLQWSDALEANLRLARSQLQTLRTIRGKTSSQNLPEALADLKKVHDTLPQRVDHLRLLKENYDLHSEQLCPLLSVPDIDPALFDTARLQVAPQELDDEYARVEKQLASYDLRLDELEGQIDQILSASKKRENDNGNPDSEELFAEVINATVFKTQNLLADFSDDILTLQLLQAQARTESVELSQVDLTAEAALEVARFCRRDWMNTRAALVDSWRLIEFNADDLESSLDIVFSGDISNTGDNPLRLRDSTGRLQVGLQFDAPITRLSERNTYRQALIEYQQARRSYYRFEDQVGQSLRGTIRTIEANKINFEIRRFAVRVAAEQIVLNEAILKERQGESSGATAARDAVSALSDLQNAQNDFLSVWVNYEVLRHSLDLDLGTMQLDSEGLWIDPGPIGPDYGADCVEVFGDYSEEVLVMPHLEATDRLNRSDLPTEIIPSPPAEEGSRGANRGWDPAGDSEDDSDIEDLPGLFPASSQQTFSAIKPPVSSRRTATRVRDLPPPQIAQQKRGPKVLSISHQSEIPEQPVKQPVSGRLRSLFGPPRPASASGR